MTADIRLAVSVIQTVFAQNHRAAATAADDHANTPNNKKSPSPSNELRPVCWTLLIRIQP